MLPSGISVLFHCLPYREHINHQSIITGGFVLVMLALGEAAWIGFKAQRIYGVSAFKKISIIDLF